MSANVTAIYTCIAGDYDDLLHPLLTEKYADYFCFTDQEFKDPGPWRLKPLPMRSINNTLASRYVKMHPHLLFPDYQTSVWVDSNIRILGGVCELTASVVSRGRVGIYRHPFRESVSEEGNECALIGHDFLWRIRHQLERYVAEGFPSTNILFETNVLVRCHHDPKLVRAMNNWWEECSFGIHRDQLSLPYVLWRHGIDFVDLKRSDPRIDQRHFRLTPLHKKPPPAGQRFLGWLNALLMKLEL